jgi:hypothetical protein
MRAVVCVVVVCAIKCKSQCSAQSMAPRSHCRSRCERACACVCMCGSVPAYPMRAVDQVGLEDSADTLAHALVAAHKLPCYLQPSIASVIRTFQHRTTQVGAVVRWCAGHLPHLLCRLCRTVTAALRLPARPTSPPPLSTTGQASWMQYACMNARLCIDV